MSGIPLVNNNSVDAINTSIIAIKKNMNNGQLKDVDVNVDINIAQNATYCAASSTTLKGAKLDAGNSIKVMFTSAILGSNTTSPLIINYNDVNIPVKTGKDGSLVDFVANNINGTYIYCQAYTTLELMFDGTQFIIMGNPVVISSADYTIYTDGKVSYFNNVINHALNSNANNFIKQGKVAVDCAYNAINGYSETWGIYVSISIVELLRGIQFCFRYSDGVIAKRTFFGGGWSDWSIV